jgi:hypothetical protein
MSRNHIQRPLTTIRTPRHYDLYDPAGGRFGFQKICMSADQLPLRAARLVLGTHRRADRREGGEGVDNRPMETVSVRTARLADQANRCRRLAEGLPDETVRQKKLPALAAEDETQVLARRNAHARGEDAPVSADIRTADDGPSSGPSALLPFQ